MLSKKQSAMLASNKASLDGFPATAQALAQIALSLDDASMDHRIEDARDVVTSPEEFLHGLQELR